MRNELKKTIVVLERSVALLTKQLDKVRESLANYKDEDLKPVFVSELLPYCNERMKNVLIEYTLLYGEYAKITDVTETRLSCIDGVGKLTLIRFNELIETI